MSRKLWTSSMAAIIVSLCSVSHADSLPQTGSDRAVAGSTSAAALYNLGNAYARQGKPALAVLNYERALILAPRDQDVAANLRQVRQSAGIANEPPSFSDRLRWVGPDTGYWLGCTGLLLAGAGWLLLSFRQPRRFASRLILGAGLILIAFSINDAFSLERLMQRSVVLQSAAASASPISGTDPIFTVPTATVVQRQGEHAGFSLIRDPQGRVGWVPRGQLLPIDDHSGDLNAKT
jgi:hypothetical protein